MAVTIGDFVYHSYSAGFIVLSYFVSVVGCWTALELLHKRTTTRGTYNWFLLLGAATSMGAVAIWSMHFIGNRAITMDQGQADLQIEYSPAFTAGSFFLPICVVALAFYSFSITESISVVSTMIGGPTTGFAVCGMHYLGQGGIANYQAVYNWRYVVGSAIVAVVAATIALGVFFHLKSAWTNTCWKRMSSAMFLAVAVSGMHWLATVGTSYRIKAISGDIDRKGLSRQATVIVIICLALGCCSTLLVFAIVGQQARLRSANRAQQVVLACATWDPDGRLMVTPEGSLPCRKITNTYIERSFDDVFSIDHPVFCWIFRASRYWKGIAELIPGMRNHLRSTNVGSKSQSTMNEKIRHTSIDGTEDYSQTFKQLFCVAAYDLASMIQEPFDNIGVLYDEIMSTGTLRRSKRDQFLSKSANRQVQGDLEKASGPTMTFGRGQLLFVVRQTNKPEAAQLQANGYRFATVPNIIDHLARSMQVTLEELRPRLESMRNYVAKPSVLEPGVHLACFALRPLFQRGFDILVRKSAKNLLPTVQIPISELQSWHTDFISRMDDWTVAACLERLRKLSEISAPDERQFIEQLHNGIVALADQVNHPFFLEARLTARPLRAPCRGLEGTASAGQAAIIAFRVMTDVHQSRSPNHQVEFTPSRFFLCQQHVYPDAPDHAIFARRSHREFAMLNQGQDPPDSPNPRHSIAGSRSFGRAFLGRQPSSMTLPRWNMNLSKRDLSEGATRSDSSSEKHLVDVTTNNPFGSIHISNNITVDVSELRNGDRSPGLEMSNLGGHSEAAVAPVERESFVDELMSLTIRDKRQQR